MATTFPQSQSIREFCAGTYKTEASLQATIIAAIYAAIATAETFTTTVSVSGLLPLDIQNCMRNLIKEDYQTSLSGTTLTISW